MSQSIDIEIAEIYNERFLKLGPVPEASMWYSRKRQFARFDVIIEQIRLLATNETVTITDIGCGYGAFLEFLLERKFPNAWRYYGHDLSQEVVEFCKKKYSHRGSFYTGSVPTIKSDFIIMSGTYNFFPSHDYNAWREYFHKSLNLYWPKIKRAMIFNLQTADKEKITDAGIVYSSKIAIESFCKSNFGNVSVITNPIIPRDVTFVLKK